AVDDRCGRLARIAPGQLSLGREGDAADARSAVAGRLADEQKAGGAAPLEVGDEALATARGALAVAVEVERRADSGGREALDERCRVHPGNEPTFAEIPRSSLDGPQRDVES